MVVNFAVCSRQIRNVKQTGVYRDEGFILVFTGCPIGPIPDKSSYRPQEAGYMCRRKHPEKDFFSLREYRGCRSSFYKYLSRHYNEHAQPNNLVLS